MDSRTRQRPSLSHKLVERSRPASDIDYPAGVVMTKVDDTHWTVTLHGIEGTNIGYKYVLGDWNYVEKDASCAEISDRPLTVSFGQDGTQTVEDVVLNWRNVDTCPN